MQGLPQADNGYVVVSIDWPAVDAEDQDWDFFLYGPDGAPVGSGATLANPEVIRIPDPKPGTYTLVADNYAGGSAAVRLVRHGHLREPDAAQPDRDQGGVAAELRRQAGQPGGHP